MRSPKICLATLIASGSYASTLAPAERSDSMSGIAGASRMSSVRGLNASPHTPRVFPFSEPKCLRILPNSRVFCAALTDSTASRIRNSYFRSAAKRIIAFTSFGKQLPP
jgi:hypothetical protein